MKKGFKALSFILLFITSFSLDMIYSQSNESTSSKNNTSVDVTPVTKVYTMRLDFMTESQVDDLIESGTVGLEELCSYTMGCQNRKDIILSIGDKIKLFTDNRIKSVELIHEASGKKTSIATSSLRVKENFIIVPQEINRENIKSYSLFILK